jgi:OOP family OmpA-OmpF porin
MYKILTVSGALIALAAAAPAVAQDSPGNPDGFYFGAGLGEFSSVVDDIDKLDDVDDVGLDFDEDEDASKIFAGWRFNRFFAVQVDYVDFGKSDAAVDLLDVSAETTGLTPSVVGTLPLGPVELFARAGMMFYDVEFNSDSGPLIDESGEDLVYSAGVGLDIGERLNLRLEYEVIDIDEFDDADALWLNAAWKF